MAEHAPIYAVLAEFEQPEALVEAARALQTQGWSGLNAYTPFPVKGLAEALGIGDRKVPTAMLVGGTAGAACGLLMQIGTNLAYPLWVGGRPLIALPAFVLIACELLVLGAVLAGIGTMFFADRLPRLNHPVFEAEQFDLASNDRFFLAIHAEPGFDRAAAGKALAALRPHAIIEIPARAAT